MPRLEATLQQIAEDLKSLRGRTQRGEDVSAEVDRLAGRVLDPGGSRYVGEHASREAVDHVASGNAIEQGKPFGKGIVRGKAFGGRQGSIESFGDPRRGRQMQDGMFAKALAEATQASGGYLVPIEVASDVAMAIRANAVVRNMGCTVVPVRKELDLPAISVGATANYTAENAAISTSQQTFAIVAQLLPKALAALVPVSNRLLRDAQTNPPLEQLLLRDIAEVIRLREDLAFLQGTGTGEPLGLKNVAGVTAMSLGTGNGATPSFDDLKNVVASQRANNAGFAAPGWIFSSRTLSTIERLKDGQGRYLGEQQSLLSFDVTGKTGTLLGYKFAVENQIPSNLTVGTSNDASYIIFSGDWQEAYIGENEQLTLDSSGEASYTPDGGTTWVGAFQNQQTVFRATLWHDFALRRPGFFTVLSGVRS